MRFSLLPSLFLVFFSLVTALPQGSASKAWAEALPAKVTAASTADHSGFNPGSWLMGLYRDSVSRVDGDRCPSIPSCSSYSVQAMKKHGFFLGWMMTVDRLIHEGKEETKVSPVVYSEGKWKIFDPVENNDFWWYPPDRKDPD
jgi:hypothetical protein